MKFNPINSYRTAISRLHDNDGITYKNGRRINYKSGWQVATEGVEVRTIDEAVKAVASYEGCCGVWYSNGIYYVDKSHRENTKRVAMEIGRKCHQISILKWSDMSLHYC